MKKSIEHIKKIIPPLKLYFLSLMFLFCMIFFAALKIPEFTKEEISFGTLITKTITSNLIPTLMLIFVIICEFIRRDFELSLKGNTGDSLEIVECKSESYEQLTFLATYIFPFLGFSFDSSFRLISYIILLVIVGIIIIRTDKFYANPTLAIFGYKLYKINFKEGETIHNDVTVLTRDDIEKGQNVHYSKISDKVFFVRSITI